MPPSAAFQRVREFGNRSTVGYPYLQLFITSPAQSKIPARELASRWSAVDRRQFRPDFSPLGSGLYADYFVVTGSTPGPTVTSDSISRRRTALLALPETSIDGMRDCRTRTPSSSWFGGAIPRPIRARSSSHGCRRSPAWPASASSSTIRSPGMSPRRSSMPARRESCWIACRRSSRPSRFARSRTRFSATPPAFAAPRFRHCSKVRRLKLAFDVREASPLVDSRG